MMPYSDEDMAALANAHGERVRTLEEEVECAQAAYRTAHKVAAETMEALQKALRKRDAYRWLAVSRGRKLKALRERINVLESENRKLRARRRQGARA